MVLSSTSSSSWQWDSTTHTKQAVRLAVLLTCTIVVIVQLTECFSKLLSPPVSTHSKIVLNNSLSYPALTVCRSPPYKHHVLKKYNLGSDIRWTSEWDNFPFGNVTLQQFWQEASYRLEEVMPVHALSNRPDLLSIENETFFLSGRCQTLVPLTQTLRAGSLVGYSVILKHGHLQDSLFASQRVGWHVHIHQVSEAWRDVQSSSMFDSTCAEEVWYLMIIKNTENGMEMPGREESLFLEVGEELQVKVAAQQFFRLNQPSRPCNDSHSYSASKCVSSCHWNQLAQSVGCSAPWLTGVSVPHCTDAASHKKLVVSYVNSECEIPCCNCIQPCHITQYSASVVNRKPFPTTTTNHTLSQLYVFFTSKMVSVVEEHYSYDWSLFVADVGGSLGFLLGLSVLGVIGIIEKIIEITLHCSNELQKNKQWQQQKKEKKNIKQLTVDSVDINKNLHEIDGIGYQC